MKIDDSMKKKIQEEMDRIQTPSSLYKFVENIKQESEKREDLKKTVVRKRGWKKYQFVIAAVISLVILTGSAFLKPTMAEVISKIPYLGQVFHKPIQVVITEALEEEGYNPVSIGMGMWEQRTLFDIQLNGTEEYVKQVEDKVLKISSETLEKRGYDNYELMVSESKEVSPVLEEIRREREEIGEKLMLDLELAGYQIMDVKAQSPIVKVYIPIADEAKKVEIYKAAVDLLKAKETPKQVQIITRDVSKEEIEGQWISVTSSIEQEFFLKKEYQVADIRYSYKPEKVSITILTNMKSSNPETRDTVTKIRKEITEFLDSEEVKTKTENHKYELIIQDKNGNDFVF